MALCSGFCFSVTSFVILVILLNYSTPSMAAEEFRVGDNLGWRRPSINETDVYSVWASKRKFHVGDLLRFVYLNDSVVKVEKWGYYHCNLSSPNETVYTDGNNTLITLDKPGPAYFVSGDLDHCKDGQRLFIQVLPLNPIGPPHSPPPMAAGSPESSWEMPPAPSSISNAGATVDSSVHGAVFVFLGSLVAAWLA